MSLPPLFCIGFLTDQPGGPVRRPSASSNSGSISNPYFGSRASKTGRAHGILNAGASRAQHGIWQRQGKDRHDAAGKEAEASLGRQGARHGARRLRHDLRQDRRRPGLQRALHDGIRRLRLAGTAGRRPRQLHGDGRARRPDLPGHDDARHLRCRHRLRRPAQRRAHRAGLRARPAPRRSRSRTRCSPRNAGTRRAGAWCRSSRWCARSRSRRRAAPRPISSSSPAPTRAPTTASTRRCGAARPTPRPAPTSCSSRARRARRRWRGSAGISTCRCSPTWPTAGARRSCPGSGWRSSATSIAIFPATGFLATAKALERVYGVLKDKGSSDTLGAELYPFDKFCRLVGFEHVWEFDKRWPEA